MQSGLVLGAGQSLLLVGNAVTPNPGALVFTWSTTAGMLSAARGTLVPTDAGIENQTVFTCPTDPTAPSPATVMLTLSDGLDASACDMNLTTATVPILCGTGH